MMRHFILCSALSLCACDIDDQAILVDPAEDALARSPQDDIPSGLDVMYDAAALQSDVEALVELDLFDVFNAEPLPGHVGIASCLDIPLVDQMDWRPGDEVSLGGWGWDVLLDRCPIGPGAWASGVLRFSYPSMLDLPEDVEEGDLWHVVGRSAAEYREGMGQVVFEARMVDSRGRDIWASGHQVGDLERHDVRFEAELPRGEDSFLRISFEGAGASLGGPRNGRSFVRDGRLYAEVIDADGRVSPYRFEVRNNVRKAWRLYPERGYLDLRHGARQPVAMQYLPVSHYTGEVLLRWADGRVQRAWLPQD